MDQDEPTLPLPSGTPHAAHEAETLPPKSWDGTTDAPTQYLIGPYRLLKQLGAGGMGEVWVAEQTEPVKRQVALKLIKSGIGSKEIITRFGAERQALALMNHPNIAKILDAGTTADGQPFFVMELVNGQPLTEFCDQQKLGIADRLKLFADICSGVQHAHQKGIVHRDLKPGNIIVGFQDGQAVPKIIDFGLAKAMESTQRLTEQSLMTGIGQILGTLKYMSPEQASLDNVDIDTRSDIYSLGVILYELLTGSTPLDHSSLKGQAALQVLEFIRDREPVKPSSKLSSSSAEEVSTITGQRRTDSVRLRRILAGDLDWIVMKALEKDRTRRYESASGFAADIQRYLNSEPVIARPPSLNYRVRKFVRKNRVGVFAALFLTVSVFCGFAGTTVMLFRALAAESLSENRLFEAEKAKQAAEVQAKRADQNFLTSKQNELIADARYFIGQSDAPNAMNRIKEVTKLQTDVGPGLQDEIRASLLLNDVLELSRSRITYEARIPVRGRDAMIWENFSTNEEWLVDWEVGKRSLNLVNLQSDVTHEVQLESSADSIAPVGSKLLVCGTNAIAVISVSREGLHHESFPFPDGVEMVCFNEQSLGVILNDDTFAILSINNLDVEFDLKLRDLPKITGMQGKPRYFMSSQGKYIIVHSAPWSNPATLICTDTGLVKQWLSGQLRLDSTGQLVFDQSDEDAFVATYSPSRDGGMENSVQFCRITEDFGVEITKKTWIDSQSIKRIESARIGKDGLTVFGSQGFTYFPADGLTKEIIQRYENIWPMGVLNFACSSNDGSVIALRESESLLLFRNHTTVRQPFESTSSNYCQTNYREGTLTVEAEVGKLLVELIPVSTKGAVVQGELSWFESGFWYTWGVDVSVGGDRVALLAQETDGNDTVSSRFLRKRLVVYDTSNGLGHSDSWKPVCNCEIPDLFGIHGFENFYIKITPDGKRAYLRVDNKVLVIDVSTGKVERSGRQNFDVVSPNGQLAL